jgi:hypothetical protein
VVSGLVDPRIAYFPTAPSSLAGEAIDFCRHYGLELDPWEELVLERSLGVRDDGRWAAFEVGLMISRQNGKGVVLEARELVGLFLISDDRFLVHSAHQFDTSLEAFRRLWWRIEDNPDLEQKVKRRSMSHGEEGIELLDGSRVRFRTRTKGGGRGFSADWLGLDEAMFLPESTLGALLPTLSARPNPQVWYAGSAVDQLVHDHGVVFARVRERGIRGKDPGLAYFEWSIEGNDPDDVDPEIVMSEEAWAQANPALGIRISSEHVANEQRSMDPRSFAVERLGVGDWPPTSTVSGAIRVEDWVALADPASVLADPVYLAFDITPDRRKACIVAAGQRLDGLPHVEVIDHRRGTGWLVGRLKELKEKHRPVAIVCDGPARSMVPALNLEGVTVTESTAGEYAQACGLLVDRVEQGKLRHLGTPELLAAIRGASTRTLGDAWAWSRRASTTDISPLVAATLALWATTDAQPSVYGERGLLVV